MATLTVATLVPFLDLGAVTTKDQKLPIVSGRIESFLSLDHSRQEFRRTVFGFKLLANDYRTFQIPQWFNLRQRRAGDVVQVDRPKAVLMGVLLVCSWLSFLFADITDVKSNASTGNGHFVNRHDNWLRVGFTPGAV